MRQLAKTMRYNTTLTNLEAANITGGEVSGVAFVEYTDYNRLVPLFLFEMSYICS
mgnify:CR=1 FL=1